MTIVQNRGIEIFFEDSGAGPPVVLGHSFLCSGKMWREQVPALAAKFRVINPDLRGHGRSGHVARPFSLYDALSDVIAVLDQLGIERASWCGLSIGGMVALRAALARPDRVAGLILLDTDAGAETAPRKLKYHAMGAGVRVIGLRPFLPSITRLMFGATRCDSRLPDGACNLSGRPTLPSRRLPTGCAGGQRLSSNHDV